MIGKIKKGKSFGGCIRYVMGKDNAAIIDSDGVLLGNIREITDSFNYQRELNPKIKQPVGHIALSFKPEDKTLLTDEFMAKIAQEYMELMGIQNTQFILVRHHNTDNPHCHLVYNRIGYDGKVISSQGDYKRNEIATKLLKDKYGLTYAEDKGKTNVKKLHTSERVKYEIFNAVKAALKHSKTWKEFNDYLIRRDIRLEFVEGTTKDTGRRASSRRYGAGTVQPDKRHLSRRAVISGRTLTQTQEEETKEERIWVVASPFFIQIIHEH